MYGRSFVLFQNLDSHPDFRYLRDLYFVLAYFLMNIFLILLGPIAGITRACQGAFKDTPWEPFEIIKFGRSVLLSTIGAIFFYLLAKLNNWTINPAILFPMIVVFDSITTEVYKRGFRVEDLSKYKMPTIFHINGRIIHNRLARAILGLSIWISLWSLVVFLGNIYNQDFNPQVYGMLWGGLAGLLVACGGALLDTAWEGFDVKKFPRSIYNGLFWGLILSFYSDNAGLLLAAVLGMDRMGIEFFKSFIRKARSGKFKSIKPTIPEWMKKREKFHPYYMATWLLYIFLLVWFKP